MTQPIKQGPLSRPRDRMLLGLCFCVAAVVVAAVAPGETEIRCQPDEAGARCQQRGVAWLHTWVDTVAGASCTLTFEMLRGSGSSRYEAMTIRCGDGALDPISTDGTPREQLQTSFDAMLDGSGGDFVHRRSHGTMVPMMTGVAGVLGLFFLGSALRRWLLSKT